MPVFTTDAHHQHDKHDKARRITNEVILWLGFIASVATLVAFIVLIADIVNREGVTFKGIDRRLQRIEEFLLPDENETVVNDA